MPGFAAGFLTLVEMDLGTSRQADGLLTYGHSGGPNSFTQNRRAIGGSDLAAAVSAGTHLGLNGLKQRWAFPVFPRRQKTSKKWKIRVEYAIIL